MKKIVLSLAGVLAATAFAPEAMAIPSYARQVGMACTACHAQHFPVLNSFGRAFKSAGYTMMGAQGKVEGDHLSLPDTLNASMLLKVRYQKTNIAGAANTNLASPTLGDGQLQFGEEFALFFGGRIAENVGFFYEGNLAHNAGPLSANLKMPFMFDVGAAKVGIIPFFTDNTGATAGFELSSGAVARTNRWSENRADTSAIQYISDQSINDGAATGFTLVAVNDMGFISATKYAPSFMTGGGAGVHVNAAYKSNYFRIAATPTVGDWAMVVGAGSIGGGGFSGGTGAMLNTKARFFDFQAQGQVGGKEIAVYAQHAKGDVTAEGNEYNANLLVAGCVGLACATDRKAWTIGVDYTIIPHALSLGAAYRNAETGSAISAANQAVGVGKDNNAITVQAVYDLYQNVALHAVYTRYSGNSTNTSSTGVVATKNATLLMLEAGF